jgi:hypothetical protein
VASFTILIGKVDPFPYPDPHFHCSKLSEDEKKLRLLVTIRTSLRSDIIVKVKYEELIVLQLIC